MFHFRYIHSKTWYIFLLRMYITFLKKNERIDFKYMMTCVTCTFGGHKRENLQGYWIYWELTSLLYNGEATFDCWKVECISWPELSLKTSNLNRIKAIALTGILLERAGFGVRSASAFIQLHHLVVICPWVECP